MILLTMHLTVGSAAQQSMQRQAALRATQSTCELLASRCTSLCLRLARIMEDLVVAFRASNDPKSHRDSNRAAYAFSVRLLHI